MDIACASFSTRVQKIEQNIRSSETCTHVLTAVATDKKANESSTTNCQHSLCLSGLLSWQSVKKSAVFVSLGWHPMQP